MRPLAQVYERLPLPFLSLSHSFSPACTLFAYMSCHLAYCGVQHSIYIWIKLLHATPDGLRGSREPREMRPLNNERMIRDKLSNGENDLNHAVHPPSSPPPFTPLSPCRVMDRSIFDVPYYWCLTSNCFES